MNFDVQKFVRLYNWAYLEGLFYATSIRDIYRHQYIPQYHNGQKDPEPGDPNYLRIDFKNGEVVKFFPVGNIPALQAMTDELERVLSDPKYQSVRMSHPVSQLIREKRKDIRKGALEGLAKFHVRAKRDDDFMNGMRAAFLVGGPPTKPLIVGYGDNKVCYVFDMPEDDVVQKILDLPAKRKGPTPKSVLVKMAALRINKMSTCAKERHQSISNDYYKGRDYDKQRQQLLELANLPEMRSVKDVLHFIDTHWALYRNLGTGTWPLEDLKSEFLQRPDITDEIISDAYDRYAVGEVMDV